MNRSCTYFNTCVEGISHAIPQGGTSNSVIVMLCIACAYRSTSKGSITPEHEAKLLTFERHWSVVGEHSFS